jgi:hypothetical protein
MYPIIYFHNLLKNSQISESEKQSIKESLLDMGITQSQIQSQSYYKVL